MKSELPKGWELSPISSLISPDGLFTDGDWIESKDQDPNGDVRLIQLADIGDGVFRNKSSRFLTSDKAVELKCTFLKEGDILLARMPDPLGRVCIFPLPDKGKFVTVVDVCIIRTSVDIASSQFLQYAINFAGTRKQIEALQTGTTRKRISRKNLATVKIPLPPLNEQKRIVAKIEELFSELDAGEQSLRDARQQLTLYRQSLLKQAFEGKLTETWRANNPDKLEDPETLLTRIQQERESRYQQQLQDWQQAVQQWEENGKEGKKPPRIKKNKVFELVNIESTKHPIKGWIQIHFVNLTCSIRGGTTAVPIDEITNIPILRSNSIRNANIDYQNIRYLEAKQKFSSTDYVKLNDLLFTRLNGTVEYVGNCVAVTKEPPTNLVYPDRLYCAKLTAIASPSYIETIFQTPAVRSFIEDRAKSTAGHKRISISDLEDVKIPFMSYDEQQEIVRILDEQFTAIEQNEKEIDHALTQSQALRQSILQKAFSGELC